MNYLSGLFTRKPPYKAVAFSFALMLVLFVACGGDNTLDNNDTIAPAELTNVNGISGDGQITLSWTDPTDADFSRVEITYNSDNVIRVNKGIQTAVIPNLTNGTAYTFRLMSVDESGNRSAGVVTGPHTPVGADPNDQTPPAEIRNLSGTAGNGQVTLNWSDPTDTDFTKVVIAYTPNGSMPVEIGKGAQTAVITGLSNNTEYVFTIKTVDASGNESSGVNSDPITPSAPVSTASVVYMTTDISSEGLMAVYERLGRKPAAGQKVGVKISTGEGTNSNHLRPDLIQALVQAVGGDIIECNTAYGGSRSSTAMHYQVARDRGYTNIATVVIMDENGSMDIPVRSGTHLTNRNNRVGAHFADYKFHVVLSHFKGHAMAGYGGALKNMSIGYASSQGKSNIHSGGTSWSGFSGSQNAFLESMAEAAKSIVDYAGSENFIYINVMNRLSVDCDCDAHPSEPTMADIGILASLDPVALDKACLDFVDNAADGADLRNRISNRNGKLCTTHAAELGLGSLEYQLIRID